MHDAEQGWSIDVVRPLLGVHKAQLRQLCRDSGNSFVDDPTNLDMGYTRTLLRKHLGTDEYTPEDPDKAASSSGRVGGVHIVEDVLRLVHACNAARIVHRAQALYLLAAAAVTEPSQVVEARAALAGLQSHLGKRRTRRLRMDSGLGEQGGRLLRLAPLRTAPPRVLRRALAIMFEVKL